MLKVRTSICAVEARVYGDVYRVTTIDYGARLLIYKENKGHIDGAIAVVAIEEIEDEDFETMVNNLRQIVIKTLKGNKKPKLIVLLGDTCVGKTTLEQQLIIELDVKPIEIYTDRKPREDDPTHYTFLETDEFESVAISKPLDFFFHTEINDRWYGYDLPTTEEYGEYIISYIHPENAIFFANLAYKRGFHVIFAHMTATEEEVSKCLQERDVSKEEADNRAELTQVPFNNTLLNSDIGVWEITRGDGLESLSYLLRR